jgi:hypothetical protein
MCLKEIGLEAKVNLFRFRCLKVILIYKFINI